MGGARRRIVVVLSALVLGLLAPATASASLGDLLGNLTNSLGLSSTTAAVGQLEQTLNADAASLAASATEQLCTLSTQVNQTVAGIPLLGSPLSTGTSSVNALVCELGLVQLDFHTIYRAPGGSEVVHDTFAVPELPTPIDLTGDGVPDAIGLVTLSNVNQISLSVTKLATAPSNLPAQVELILRNPSNVQSNSRIGVGFDARDFNMPRSFTAGLSILGFSPLHLALSVKQGGDPAGIALLGSLFNLQADGSRVTTARARMQFVPDPSTMGYDLTLDSNHQHLTATSDLRSTVTAGVSLISGTDEQTIDGTINQLPTQADVDILNTDSSHRAITYNASQSIGDLNMTYRDVTHALGGDALNTEIVGHVQSLPTGVTLTQTGARAAKLTTSGGPIGLVEGGFATGEHVIPMPGTESGANVISGGGLTSVAARLSGLQAATVDASGPYTADVQASSQPLHVIVKDSDTSRTIDATVHDLPAHIALSVDPDHGKVSENGFGQGIASVTADASSAAPFFASAKRLHAVLLGIPTSFNLQFAKTSGGFSASIDHPVNQIDFTADDGSHSVSVPGSDSGATYHDVPGEFAVAGRVFGLRSVSFQSDPLTVGVQSAAGHVFNMAALVQLGGVNTTATGTIDQLPSSVNVALAPSGDTTDVKYTASSPISKLSLDATRSTPFFASAQHLHTDLSGIPAAFDLAFAKTGDAFTASMDHPVNQIDFAADDGTHSVSVPGSDSGLAYHDVPGTFALAGRVFGLQSVSFKPDPLAVDVQTAGGHVFNLDGLVQVGGQNLTASGVIDKLPSDVGVTVTRSGTGTTADYTASSRIDRIELRASGPQFVGRAHFLYGKVLGLPRKLHVEIPGDQTLFKFDAGGDSIDQVEFQALDDPSRQLVEFPQTDGSTSPTADGAVYHDLTNGEYTLAAQLSGLRSASLVDNGELTAALDIDPAKAKVFGLDIKTGSASAPTFYNGYIDRPPPSMKLTTFFGTADTIQYTAGAPINDIVLNTNVAAPVMQFHFHNIPTALDVCLGTGNDNARPCVRPRPSGYPADSGDNRDGDHLAVLNIDDHGSSPDSTPLTINSYICFTPADNGDCSSGAAKKYLVVNNLQLHNMMFDLFAQTCTGLLFCGHIGLDTRGRPLTGAVTYYDSTISQWLDSITAPLVFPSGFSANYRYTSWANQPIGSGGDDNVDDPIGIHFDQFGSVNCPSGTEFGLDIQLLGGAQNHWNIAPEYLCS